MRLSVLAPFTIYAAIVAAAVTNLEKRQVSCVVDGQTVFGDCECGCNVVSTGVETPPICEGNGVAPCDDCAVVSLTFREVLFVWGGKRRK